MERQKVFGLAVIGDEIISGKRRDGHFEGVAAPFRARGLRLGWAR
jgi:molybdopterin-biosynthesis enzyme MoeA-like protein